MARRTRAVEAVPRSRATAAVGAVGISGAAAAATAFALSGSAAPHDGPLMSAPVALRGSAPAVNAGASSASVTATTAAALAALGGAAIALKPRRSTASQARRASAVSLRAVGPTGTWEPRYTGWDNAELVAERQRVMALENAPAGYSGPIYEGPSSVTDAFINSLIDMQAQGQLLPLKSASLMVLDAISIFNKESTMQEMTVSAGQELKICGDLHGQYWDFMNMLKLAGKPSPDSPFIFNGDFVDRGSWSIEVILTLVAFKIKDPQLVGMNRGNHEMLETNILYGFCGECGSKYDMDLFNLFSEMFRNLPLCHRVNQKVLVLHAGLPGPDPRIWMPGQTHDPTDSIPMNYLATLEEIAAVDRFIEITPQDYQDSIGPRTSNKDEGDKRKLIDVVWGDPRGGDGYGPSYRKGKGVYMFGPNVSERFCQDNGLQCIIRSHEVKADGTRWDHPKVLTVFSAPNYLDTGNNKGAFLRVTAPAPGGDLNILAETFTAVPHPELPPMHWQQHIVDNYSHLTKKMRKKVSAMSFDEFGDSDFEGISDLMNFDEWEPEEADQFQDAFKVDEYGRVLDENNPPEEMSR